MKDDDNPDYPPEIKSLILEVHSTRNAIHNAWRQGRDVPAKTTKELKRLEKRLEKMKQLYWMVCLSTWIKNL